MTSKVDSTGIVVEDEPRRELSRLITPDIWLKVGKSTIKDQQSELHRRFRDLIAERGATWDAVTIGPYLRLVLAHIENGVKELASGYSASRWLWYLRRLPIFVFSGNLRTTYAYDAALAEAASGLYGTGADNLRVNGNVFHYSLDGAVPQRIMRFCHAVRMMSTIHMLLRYAGKGSAFRFGAGEGIPSATPERDVEKAIELYDRRMEVSQHAFVGGGTKLVDENYKESNGH